MVMGRKRKHSESTDNMVAPSSDKSPSADCSDRPSSKGGGGGGGTGVDTSAPPLQGSTDVVCSSLQDQDPAGGAGTTEKGVPLQRNAANERERARMRVLSKAFARLKTSLPWVPADTKLSKLDTLRLASCYIAHLSQLLAEDSEDQQTTSPIHGTGGTGAGTGGTGGGNNNSVTISSSTTAAITSTNIHPLNLTWPFTFSSRNSSSMGVISSSSPSSVDNNRITSRTNINHPTKYTAALDKVEASSA